MVPLRSLLLAATSGTLPYPGMTYQGRLPTPEGSCALIAWQGSLPAYYLLGEQEKRELGKLLDRVESRWQDAPPQERRGLLKRYLELTSDLNAPAPFFRKTVFYTLMSLKCGEGSIQAAYAIFPAMAGAMLYAVDPSEPAKRLFIQDMFTEPSYLKNLLRSQASQPLGLGQDEEEKAGQKPSIEQADELLEKARHRIWECGWQTYPGCAEKCDAEQLRECWSKLAGPSQKAFAALLGILDRPEEKAGEPEPEELGLHSKGLSLPRLMKTWSPSLGENPFLQAQVETSPLDPEARLSFSAPPRDALEALFGSSKAVFPVFEEDLQISWRNQIMKTLR